MTCTASQAPLAAKRPEGRWLRSHAVLEVSDGVLDLGVAAMVGLQFQGVSLPVGDEGVIAVAWANSASWEPGEGLTRSDDEPHRSGVGFSTLKGV